MMITTRTTVGFKIPDDYKEEKIFMETVDTNEWVENETSGWVYYTKQSTYYSKPSKKENR